MIEYDSSGRMKYNKEFHSKQGTYWSEEDTEYLANWGNKVSMEEMSFALERSEGSVIEKLKELRKTGIVKGYSVRGIRLLKDERRSKYGK
ncbi:hypothetical protein [Clostridium sp. BJN0001]|uniref:hypothetical protein n=1 Tax=Clostridium sp. BJN0001 TaxID=2930219 RepID=UPI001FD0B4DE|nr:hypothetical protein [Clostridium sp. BJN0001]